MSNPQRVRDSSIIRLYNDGKRQADIAKAFNISVDRVRGIIHNARWMEQRLNKFESKYGPRPRIASLPDDTPIEVLALHDGDIRGWYARLKNLQYNSVDFTSPPVNTLGDVRTMTDADLLKIPNVGKRMVRELRKFCPFRIARRSK